MPKGRKPTPTLVKQLSGNPGKRPLPQHEPQPHMLGPAEPPEWFDDEARKQWFRLVPELKRLGLLTVVDVTAIEICCQAMSDYVRYCRVIKLTSVDTAITKDGRETRSAYVVMRDKSAELVLKYLVEFGLTPSSRTRVSGLQSTGDIDPLEDLLRNRPQ